jgi:hypothetical protein
MKNSESQVFLISEDDDDESIIDMNQFFDAEEYRGTDDDLKGSVVLHSPEILTSVDNVCPAWIEMLVHRGNYARAYALNLGSGSKTVFRKADSVLELFDSSNDNISSPRMSSAEKTRRHLGQLMSSCLTKAKGASYTTILKKVESMTTSYDVAFLNQKRPSPADKSSKGILKSAFVARALSDHHFIEEWATISDRGVNFYHPERKKANHRIGIQSIVKAETVDTKDAPCFPNHYFLAVATLGRTNYILFSTQTERDDWIETISELAQLSPSSVDSEETNSQGNASTALLELQNPKDEFLHKSSLWDFKHRRVLNCRRFSFRSRDRSSQHNPLALAEDALRKALDPRNESDDDILISFLDSAAKLKEAYVHDLGDQEKLVFFLNIYHVMVMHAYLVLGVPASSFQWISYFNSISYQCSDDIFSLAELEHCIIRKNMAFPSQFLSRFVLPKSVYDIAVTQSDYRVNFALNCGSRSNPKCVPVFRVPTLEQQLDEVSRLYLASAIKAKKRGTRDVDVFLPRICLWFADDFGSSSDLVLKKVMPFLNNDVRAFLESCQSDRCNISVKHLSFSFDCRKLALTPDSGIAT